MKNDVSDYGAERLLSKVKPTPMATVCPHFADETDENIKMYLQLWETGQTHDNPEAFENASDADSFQFAADGDGDFCDDLPDLVNDF